LNLKKLEISGFKSFVNPLRMDFSRGITAVIGPNGCGKTNIVDAMRWVLGEQKTRLLRNSKMENVIFNGTRTRPPLGMAEVHLTLTNEDRGLALDYSEVTISRKLYRNGTSEYYINGELARLKTIRSLLVDTGLGNNTYSIIEREMVDSVIREKEDKRLLLEEAAGIVRYRIQREEAIRKIKHTETDLTSGGDIICSLSHETNRRAHSPRTGDVLQKFFQNVLRASVDPMKVFDREDEGPFGTLEDEAGEGLKCLVPLPLGA